MKNSPHRHNHQRKKALRKNSSLPPKSKTTPLYPDQALQGAFKDRLTNLMPFDQNKASEILHAFKKHLERERHFNSSHISKRTTPGEVEGDGPFTIMKHDTKHHHDDWKGPSVQKSADVARKMLRYQNSHKKAA